MLIVMIVVFSPQYPFLLTVHSEKLTIQRIETFFIALQQFSSSLIDF